MSRRRSTPLLVRLAHFLATFLLVLLVLSTRGAGIVPAVDASAIMDFIAADPSWSLFSTALNTLLPPVYLKWINGKDGES